MKAGSVGNLNLKRVAIMEILFKFLSIFFVLLGNLFMVGYLTGTLSRIFGIGLATLARPLFVPVSLIGAILYGVWIFN